jgi:uncharacterized protein YggE
MGLSRIALTCVACGALSAAALGQSIQINRDNKTVAISTTDEATQVADIAAITIGFEVFGPESQGTYADGGKLSRAILDALHKAGVKDESIESTAQTLQRNTDFDDKDKPEDRIKRRFVFRQSWEVSSNPQSAAEVIRASVAAGANQSGAIDWRVSDRKSLQAKAAENALVKARAVADHMAEGLHVKLGALIYASNETPNAKLYLARQEQFETVTVSASASSIVNLLPALEIRPQTIREEATVYAVFAIE